MSYICILNLLIRIYLDVLVEIDTLILVLALSEARVFRI